MSKSLFDATYDRRNLLRGAGFGAGMFALAGCTASGAMSSPYPPYANRLGIQLYSVRDQFKADYAATLEALAAIGYKDLETAGLYDHDPYAVRAKMDALGLMTRSAHVQFRVIESDLSAVLDLAAILGQTNLIVPSYPENLRNPDGYRALADKLNEAGAKAKAVGKRIGYHNHDYEFDKHANGETGFDILLSRTDPALVSFEADLFWVIEAGLDPVAVLTNSPGRFMSCHIKDRTAAGEMVDVGDGVIDFAAILEHAELAGIDHFYVEHDHPTDAMGFARRSFAALNG